LPHSFHVNHANSTQESAADEDKEPPAEPKKELKPLVHPPKREVDPSNPFGAARVKEEQTLAPMEKKKRPAASSQAYVPPKRGMSAGMSSGMGRAPGMSSSMGRGPGMSSGMGRGPGMSSGMGRGPGMPSGGRSPAAGVWGEDSPALSRETRDFAGAKAAVTRDQLISKLKTAMEEKTSIEIDGLTSGLAKLNIKEEANEFARVIALSFDQNKMTMSKFVESVNASRKEVERLTSCCPWNCSDKFGTFRTLLKY